MVQCLSDHLTLGFFIVLMVFQKRDIINKKGISFGRSWGILWTHLWSCLCLLIAFLLTLTFPSFSLSSLSYSIHRVSIQVVSQRFPQNSIGAVGSAMFLRFINPAIVSPYEAGILDKKPPPRIERGLKLMSKVRCWARNELQCGHASFKMVAYDSCFSFFTDSPEYCQSCALYQGRAYEAV